MALISMKDVSFCYPGQTTPALSGLNLSIPEGAFVLLCGAPGPGKRPLLRMLKPELPRMVHSRVRFAMTARRSGSCHPAVRRRSLPACSKTRMRSW